MARRRTALAPTRKADAILGADLHLWPRAPLCREQDEWIAAMGGKLQDIRNLQKIHDAPFLVAGDIFEKPYMEKGDQWFFSWLMGQIDNWIVIPGQHDLANHRLEAYPESNLAVLEKAGVVKVLFENGKGKGWGDVSKTIDAFPWGTTPSSCKKESDSIHIALVHKLVYPGKPPFPDAELEGSTAKALMKKMKGFDLIVSGDNHETFGLASSRGINTTVGGEFGYNTWPNELGAKHAQLLVNPGSLMRTSAKQIDHEPSVFLWHADTNTVERYILPHAPNAVNRDHIDRQEIHDEKMDVFVERLAGDVDLDLSFTQNVRRRAKESKVPAGVKEIIEEVLP